MADNDHTGGRSFLADEVARQRAELTRIGNQVAGMDATLTGLSNHYAADSAHARIYRQGVREEVNAQRSEQQQVSQSMVAVQSKLEKIDKKLDSFEAERDQLIGAGRLVAAIGKLGWAIVGAIVLGIFGLAGWISTKLH